MVKLICIDSKNMPEDFPRPEKWIKEGQVYSALRFRNMVRQNRILGVQLNEIDTDDCFPYTYFNMRRFAIPEECIEEFEELIKASGEEADSDFNIDEILEYVGSEELESV